MVEATNLGQLRGTVLKPRGRSCRHGLQRYKIQASERSEVLLEGAVTRRAQENHAAEKSSGFFRNGGGYEDDLTFGPWLLSCWAPGCQDGPDRYQAPEKKGAGGFDGGAEIISNSERLVWWVPHGTIPVSHLTTPVLPACPESPAELSNGITRQV